MRVIKLALISIIFFSLLLTVISLFIPSHIRILKAINIVANRDSVMNPIKDAAKWKSWYPGLDSARLFYDKGQLKGVVLDNKDPEHPATIYITNEQDDEVTVQLTARKNSVESGWKITNYSSGDSVLLQWYMDFHLRWYPWEKFSSLLLEKSFGSKMEQGLYNLKKLVQYKN